MDVKLFEDFAVTFLTRAILSFCTRFSVGFLCGAAARFFAAIPGRVDTDAGRATFIAFKVVEDKQASIFFLDASLD
jgi:hypothetical protein